MKLFITGATGVLGRHIVPQLNGAALVAQLLLSIPEV